MGMWKNRDIWIPASVSAAIILAVTLAAAVIISPEAAGAVAFMGICLFALFMGTAFFREKSIRKLSEELDRILHGEEGLEISHFREGDLEILRDEIAKMTWTLNQQSRRLADDKAQLSRALADISHQIRTPLTSVNLMAERMRRPDISEGEWRKLLREMSHMLGRIGWLVDTLLKLSRLDAGTVTLKQEKFPVSSLIEDALRTFAVSMELHGQTCIADESEDICISGDYTWTLEALQNVMKNALEHTPEGGKIWIEIKDTVLYVQMSVIDSGPGIPKEDIPHLFERFYRGKTAGKDSFGIGLSLSRAVLSLENAVILAENSKDRGGCFILRFYK